jgi:hypothetical protein
MAGLGSSVFASDSRFTSVAGVLSTASAFTTVFVSGFFENEAFFEKLPIFISLGKLRTRLGGIGGLVMFLWRRASPTASFLIWLQMKESVRRRSSQGQINEFGKSQFVHMREEFEGHGGLDAS